MREYRYRSIMHVTHGQYLDEPVDVIDWMLHVEQALKPRQEPPAAPGA